MKIDYKKLYVQEVLIRKKAVAKLMQENPIFKRENSFLKKQVKVRDLEIKQLMSLLYDVTKELQSRIENKGEGK